jgi:cation diffusion facilitator CzcD-associated flavoprotein CzcO
VLDGKIKVESGFIDHFTSDTVVLNGGREQKYDVVVMATGFTNVKDNVRRILGDAIGDQLTQIWGIDGEGELYGAWRDCGVPRLWLQVGTLMPARYFARIVALRIKAELEGLAPAPYAGARP